MSDDAKCQCGHGFWMHFTGQGRCRFGRNDQCDCVEFRPAEEAKPDCPECGPDVKTDEDGCCASCGSDIDSVQNPEPAPESVYEPARQAFWRIERGDYGHDDDKKILSALDAGEKAEQELNAMRISRDTSADVADDADLELRKVLARAEAAEREKNSLRQRLRNAAQIIIASIGASGPLDADQAAALIAEKLACAERERDALKARVEELEKALNDKGES